MTGLHQRLHQPLRVVEAGPEHRAAGGAQGDPLADHCELEERERLVPADRRDIKSGRARVAVDQVGATGEPRRGRHRPEQARPHQHLVVVRLAPVREQGAEIGERIPKRAHLPVEHRDDLARAARDAAVCCPSDSRRGRWRRPCAGEVAARLVAQRVERWQVVGLRAQPLLGPSAQLPLHEALRPAEIAQPHLVRVDRVQRRKTSISPAPIAARCRRWRRTRRQRVAADVPDHPLHHEERRGRALNRRCRAKNVRGTGTGVSRSAVMHAVLARHVVRGRQDVAQRRTAQDDLAGVGPDAIREVRLAARDERDAALRPAGRRTSPRPAADRRRPARRLRRSGRPDPRTERC